MARCSMRKRREQEGLRAVVAAALADPFTPLAISVLTCSSGSRRARACSTSCCGGYAGSRGAVGRVGRGWSFSTYELPLGGTDPGSLPSIVFREAQDGAQTAPARWRKEAKVRPFRPRCAGVPRPRTLTGPRWPAGSSLVSGRGGDQLEHSSPSPAAASGHCGHGLTGFSTHCVIPSRRYPLGRAENAYILVDEWAAAAGWTRTPDTAYDGGGRASEGVEAVPRLGKTAQPDEPRWRGPPGSHTAHVRLSRGSAGADGSFLSEAPGS